MRTATAISLRIIKVAAVVQLVLGILFWTGHAYPLIGLHIIIGSALVLALVTLGVLALVARVRPGFATFDLVWGLALAAFGVRQALILIGPMHWIIRVVHLLMAISAVRVGETLGQGILAAVPERVAESEGQSAARRAS